MDKATYWAKLAEWVLLESLFFRQSETIAIQPFSQFFGSSGRLNAEYYQPNFKETTQFFKTIQNKLHFATIGHTAAELVYRRADASKPLMGLTHMTDSVVRKKDIKTAKNYLNEKEISQLNRIVTMWLDFAEDQAQRKKQVFLKDWTEKLDQFLAFNEREVLQGAGKISKNRPMLKQKPNTNAIWLHGVKSENSREKTILPNYCACKLKSPSSRFLTD